MNQCQDSTHFVEPKPLKRMNRFPKNLDIKHPTFTASFSVVSPAKGPMAFCKVTTLVEREQTYGGLLDTGSELRPIPEDPKKHCSPPVKIRL